MHVNAETISRRCDHFAAEYFVLPMKICASFRSIFILFYFARVYGSEKQLLASDIHAQRYQQFVTVGCLVGWGLMALSTQHNSGYIAPLR